MALRFERGDLFATPGLAALAHGCNCAGSMGAGIALEFGRRWPAMYAAYTERCSQKRFRLGDVFTWREGGQVVFNLATQPHWRSHAELHAIAASVGAMLAEACALGLTEVAMPRIGSGLGGLAWEDVLGVIAPSAQASPVLLRICDEFSPGVALAPLAAA